MSYFLKLIASCSDHRPGLGPTASFYEKYSRNLPQEFDHRKQFIDLFVHGLLRFLITVVLIIILYQIIWSYSQYPMLDSSQKRVFNFLVTALSLALGLNLASSLKSVAVKARWWILSWKKRPLHEV